MYALCAPPQGGVPRARFTTDFSDYALGTELSAQGWSYSSASGFSAAPATGGMASRRVLVNKTGSDASRFATWDLISAAADIEILTRIKLVTLPTGSGETTGQIIARYLNTTHYYIALPRNAVGTTTKKFEVGEEAGSGPNPLDNAVFGFNTADFWWIRFRIIGTSLKGKMWANGTAEPGSWTVSTTDSSNASGSAGLGAYYVAYNYYCDFFSVAFSGGTASSPSG